MLDKLMIAIVSSAGATAITYIIKLIVQLIIQFKKSNAQKKQAMEKGIQSILRHKLQEDAVKYFERGYITPLEIKLWMSDYEIYHNLGANGVMDITKDEINKLPLKEK